MGISYWSVCLKICNSVLCHLCYIEPSHWDFYFGYLIFFSFRISFWFIISVSLLIFIFFILINIFIFYFFVCFKRICDWLMMNFYDNIIKILVRYSNIWFMSDSLVDCLFLLRFWFSWFLEWWVTFYYILDIWFLS